MESGKKLYSDILSRLEEFIVLLGPHITESTVSKMINDAVKKPLDPDDIKSEFDLIKSSVALIELFELSVLIINNEHKISASVYNTPIFKTVDVGQLLRDCDKLSFMIYELYKENKETLKDCPVLNKCGFGKSLEEIIPGSTNLFSKLNTTMLIPDEVITEKELPKSAKIVSINIPNTINQVFSMKNIIDKMHIKSVFGDLTPLSGLNEDIIKRFNDTPIYETGSSKCDVIKSVKDIDNIYEYIGTDTLKKKTKYYRKRYDYHELDHVNHYKYIPTNIFSVGVENKRLNILKRNSKQEKTQRATGSLLGVIKNNFYNKRKSIGNSVFDAIYDESLSDESLMRLYAYSSEYDNNTGVILSDRTYLDKVSNFRVLNSV